VTEFDFPAWDCYPWATKREPAVAMNCPACHSENPADSRFCHRCGTSIDLTSSPTMTFSPAEEAAAREALKFHPGEKFGDRYTIIEEIGRGGMGRVYKAKDCELDTTVVLKMIRPELTSRPGMIDQFRKETLLGRSVSHENVVRIHDLGEIDKIRYISMDFIKGEDLSELIQTSGSLTISTCLRIAIQVCRALKAAHEKNIVHQDLKPQNIMIDNAGKVFVTDFGLARSLSLSKAKRPGKISGTPKYFSPEQARGEESDPRSDIYSLGAILYEMVTGAPPFKADTVEDYIKKHTSEKPPQPSEINPHIPPACEKIILKCLEKKREDRYQSAEELLHDLEIQKTQAHAPGLSGTKRIWRDRVVAALLLLMIGVVIYKVLIPIIWPPRSSGRPSIAIMYAENNSGDKTLDEHLRWGIPYYMYMALSQSKYLHLVPQDVLMSALEDMKQMEEEHHLAKTLDRIAEASDVDYFVLPSFTKAGDELMINVIVRKARTPETLGEPINAKGKTLDDLVPMAQELSLKVKSTLSLSPAEITEDYNQSLDKITTTSQEALRCYIEANKFYIRGDFAASNQSLEKAVKEDPNFALAYLMMAENYEYLGDFSGNRSSLQKALTLVDHVSSRDRYIIRGFAAAALNDSPLPAIEIYKDMINFDPGDEEGYLRLGGVYRNLEEWDLALKLYKKILTFNPRSALALENMAFIHTAQGRYQKAADLCKTNAAISAAAPFFIRQLILIHLIQGRYDQSASELAKAIALSPDDLKIIEVQGYLDHLKGDLTAAERTYQQLRQKGEASSDTPDLQGRYRLACLHLQQGLYRQLSQEISEGTVLAERSKRFYDELNFRALHANSELQLKHFSRAIEILKPAIALAQDIKKADAQYWALHLTGLSYLGERQIEEAKKAGLELRQRIEKTGVPKHMRHYEHLMGRIALAEGHPDQAVDRFKKALKLLPSQMDEGSDSQAFYYDALAAAYYQARNWSKAIKTYKQIISLTTGRLEWGDIYARSYYWLGKIYQLSGNNTAAAGSYEIFIQMWKNADEDLPEVDDAKMQLQALRRSP
jgi:serine/threonine protein kinase/Tfp pilus assembly protein PilF